MVDGGVRNVLISNEIVDRRKIERLVALARRAEVAVCVDDPRNVDDLAAAARTAGVRLAVLVEIDVGNARCGVAPGEPAVALARHVAAQPSLRFAGLQAYYGRAQHINEVEKRRAAIDTGIADVRHTVELLAAAGARLRDSCRGAGTGATAGRRRAASTTRCRPGSYCFMDVEYGLVEGFPREFRQSLFVLATVMSRPVPERAVVDAGLKALSVDKGMPRVHGLAGVEFQRASDEHGVLQLEGAGQRPRARRPRVADPRPLRPDDQPLRLVRRRARRPGRGALADHRARRGPVTGPPGAPGPSPGSRRRGSKPGRAARSSWCTARADPRSSGSGSSTRSPTWPSVVAPDLPGHGPLGGRGRPSIAAYAEWLDGFLAGGGRGAGGPRRALDGRRGRAGSGASAARAGLTGLVLIGTGARLRVLAAARRAPAPRSARGPGPHPGPLV